MRRVVIATRSVGKLRELDPLLRQAGFSPLTLTDIQLAATAEEDHVERYETFRENALAKARYFFARSCGLPVLADDSGLEVNALGGAPGVHSKRWSARGDLTGDDLDAANNARLVESLTGAVDRSARYVCEAVWIDANGDEYTARGETAGEIVAAPRGAGGFGYDPYFYSAEIGKTFGEASLEEKAHVSHRARAVRALLALTFDA